MITKIPRINMELNITLACNLKCPSCNRCCDVYPERTEHMTLDQIEDFLQQIRDNKGKFGVKKVKIVGGEPLVHPQFVEIYYLLYNGMKEGLFGLLKINTNATLPIPVPIHPNVKWLRSPPKVKSHLPFLTSPADLGYEAKGPCGVPFRCGFSYSARGYLPCSPAIMLADAFDMEYLYKQEIPSDFWGHELCKHCIHAMPDEWVKKNSDFKKHKPTPAWEKALKNYEAKRGHTFETFDVPTKDQMLEKLEQNKERDRLSLTIVS